MIINQPITAVWEITMGCNMRCKHCGSSCHDPLAGELTTDEAFKLCDALGELGVKWVTLSGGEPTTREDWFLIAGRLSQNGVIPNIITNGWLFNEDILQKAIDVGVDTIGFSLDGLEGNHDFVRRKGSYQKTIQAISLCLSRGMNASPITTINTLNLNELPELKKELVVRGVKQWQVQMGCPMGNMAENDNLVIEPEAIDGIIDFAYQCMEEGSIEVNLSDCIGYYSLKDIELFKRKGEGAYTRQCTAGKYSFGILHNGDILGCTSIRDSQFVEGNIRDNSLKDIWGNPNSFAWNRTMKKEDLQGFCRTCRFGQFCLGGCSNTKLTTGGSIYAENRYCSYQQSVKKRMKVFESIKDTQQLAEMGRNYALKGYWQLAQSALKAVLDRQGAEDDPELLKLYGYVNFRLENYQEALEANEKVLNKEPDEVYALKGKGLCLFYLDKKEEGIKFLQRAVALTDTSFMDPYFDLAVVLDQMGCKDEAIAILEEGRSKSKEFIGQSEALYRRLADKGEKDGDG